jgi:hypothetical protein
VRLSGKISAVTGADATLVEPNGLAVDLDLSRITNPPPVGTSVMIGGVVTNGGKTVQVIRLITAKPNG